jgi:hypothetical protein
MTVIHLGRRNAAGVVLGAATVAMGLIAGVYYARISLRPALARHHNERSG